MKILVCAATEMEIAPTIHFLALKPNYSIEVLITGVGMMACAYALTKSLISHPPELIVQAGVAGSLDATLPLSQVVVVKNETIGDLGVEESAGFHSLFDIKLIRPDTFPWKNCKLCNENQMVNETGLPVVDGVTVNEISTNPSRIDYYHNRLNARIETMEGAALHYVGLLEKIPFLQIRSLSNFIGERDKTKWMMEKAVIHLNKTLQHLLTKFFTA